MSQTSITRYLHATKINNQKTINKSPKTNNGKHKTKKISEREKLYLQSITKKCDENSEDIVESTNVPTQNESSENVNNGDINEETAEMGKLRSKIKSLEKDNEALNESNKMLTKLLQKSRNKCKEQAMKIINLTEKCDKPSKLFCNFSEICENDLRDLRSIKSGKFNDSTFIKKCLEVLYKNDFEALKHRSVTGKSKQKITPTKEKIIRKLFEERLCYEKESDKKFNERFIRLNIILSKNITYLSNKVNQGNTEENEDIPSKACEIQNNSQIYQNITALNQKAPVGAPNSHSIGYTYNQALPIQSSIEYSSNQMPVCSPIQHSNNYLNYQMPIHSPRQYSNQYSSQRIPANSVPVRMQSFDENFNYRMHHPIYQQPDFMRNCEENIRDHSSLHLNVGRNQY